MLHAMWHFAGGNCILSAQSTAFVSIEWHSLLSIEWHCLLSIEWHCLLTLTHLKRRITKGVPIGDLIELNVSVC
jgi:hypothetical protein